jgi:NAD(P)-dependent dehydrogenase (short-subunit alcohol dehydrogenase family)
MVEQIHQIQNELGAISILINHAGITGCSPEMVLSQAKP